MDLESYLMEHWADFFTQPRNEDPYIHGECEENEDDR